MARGVERAAAYVPSGERDGRRVAEADEDGFTLAATALERLDDGATFATPATRLLLVGDFPASADADLRRFLGYPLAVDRFGAAPGALALALEAALDPLRPAPAVLVAVDLAPEPAGDGPRTRPSDGAVAVRISDAPGGDPIGATLGGGSEEEFPAGALRILGAESAKRAPLRWVGDFGSAPGAGRASAAPRRSIPGEGPYSQGAYVPLPRYLENLPSRWRLVGERCPQCQRIGFPPRGRCRGCGANDGLAPVALPRDGGTVVASTRIGPGGQPTEFDEQVGTSGPYGVVLVDLAPGVRVTLQVADADGPLPVGSLIGTRLRRLYPMEGEWRYGRKAVPLAATGSREPG
jgi:uncharacterized protein